MNLVTAQLVVGAIVACIEALPGVVQAIQNMDAWDADKDALISRIRTAQEGLPVWD